MLKRIVFALLLMAAVFSVSSAAKIVPEKPVLTYDKYDINEDGIFDEMVYEISTKEQLYWFANAVNNGQVHINAILMNDITVNEDLLSRLNFELVEDTQNYAATLIFSFKENQTAEEWVPIGNSKYTYKGSFDGRGYTVRGLYTSNLKESYKGLFGKTSGTIKNVNVADSFVAGLNYVGGICAYASGGNITNCTFDGYAYACNDNSAGICGYFNSSVYVNYDISYCTNYGTIVAKYSGAAGITSRLTGNAITKCANYGKVVAGLDDASGIVAFSYEPITYCYNAGEIYCVRGYANGVATVHYGTSAQYCYNSGCVKPGVLSTSATAFSVTELIGQEGTLKNCYYLNTSASGNSNATKTKATSMTEAQMKSTEFVSNLGSSSIWQQTEGEYPTLVPAEMEELSVNENHTTDTTSHIFSVSSNGVVTIAADDAGVSFTVIYSDYDGNKQNSVDFVPFTSKNAATKYTVSTSLSLSSGDKIIVIENTTSLKPVCKEYIIE